MAKRQMKRCAVAEYQTSKTHCPKGHLYDEANTKHTKDGRACRTCHRASSKARYDASGAEGRAKAAAWARKKRAANRPEAIAVQRRRRAKSRIWLEAQRLECSKCGEKHPAVLDFHHRNPAEKDFQIGHAVLSEKAKQKVLNEIAKCDVLCANCHRKHHWEERQPQAA